VKVDPEARRKGAEARADAPAAEGPSWYEQELDWLRRLNNIEDPGRRVVEILAAPEHWGSRRYDDASAQVQQQMDHLDAALRAAKNEAMASLGADDVVAFMASHPEDHAVAAVLRREGLVPHLVRRRVALERPGNIEHFIGVTRLVFLAPSHATVVIAGRCQFTPVCPAVELTAGALDPTKGSDPRYALLRGPSGSPHVVDLLQRRVASPQAIVEAMDDDGVTLRRGETPERLGWQSLPWRPLDGF